jgi:tetratricopeptide (TPR) repeat protein
MFTIHPYLKFALIAAFIIGGIVMMATLPWGYGLPVLIIGILLLVSYILLGTIQHAAKVMQANQNYLEAEKWLNLTWKPEWLYVTNRAYFYMMKGTIAQGLGRTDEAETWLQKAQTINLPSDNEKAAVQLQLASIAIQRQKLNLAKNYLKNIKELNVTEPTLKDQIKQFDKAMGQQGQMKMAQQMGMVQKGGVPLNPRSKRRRPTGR